MSGLPSGLAQAFSVAAGELGMCCAAWLYVKEFAQEGGPTRVHALRDMLGRAFPVLDAVAERWLSGEHSPHVDATELDGTLRGVTDIVVVGLESLFLDALVARWPGTRFWLLTHLPFEVDWERVLANYAGRVEAVSLDRFQISAGPSSALLTFAYGVQGAATHVVPAWLRVHGEDVRAQFRRLIAWDILRAPMYVYPRWLVEVDVRTFTDVA